MPHPNDLDEELALTSVRLDDALARLERLGEDMARTEAELPSTLGGKLGTLLQRIRRGRTERSWTGVWQRLADLHQLRASLLTRASDEQRNAEEWERRAMLCVHAKDDALAREALHRRREHLGTADELSRQADALGSVIEVLERGAAELERAAKR